VFIVYVVSVLLLSIFLAVQVAPRHGHTNILVYITICSLIGSLSVLGCKGFGLAIKETLQGVCARKVGRSVPRPVTGDQQLTNPLTWFWLVSIVVCVSVQLNYLNRALDVYNTAMVTPIYYVFFTSCVLLASGAPTIAHRVRACAHRHPLQ
jgi:predicted permease